MHPLDTVPSQSWLYPEEQPAVVKYLYDNGLIKCSSAHDLPLKSGGTTDIYINLREARNDPRVLERLAQLFSTPIRRLAPDRFVEVPDAISGIAGRLSTMINTPYSTIRAQEKEGHAAGTKVLGKPREDERAVLLDDVMTDGASKVPVALQLAYLSVDVTALVMLVDRQRGWRNVFRERGQDHLVDRVWPGMTLHDVRKHLIQTLGLMQRCNPEAEERNRLVVALDGKEWDDLFPFLEFIRPTGSILKVNDMLFNEGMKRLLPELAVYGRIMADIKAHDIPPTVEHIFKHLAPYNVWGVTVHASGQYDMIRKAVECVGNRSNVLAVTVLTSFDERTCEEVYMRQPRDQVLELARIAHSAGAHGFVCSPQEVSMLKQSFPEMVCVTPGVRSADADKGAQQRVTTPREAVENGADHIVMGGEIQKAIDPIEKVKQIVAETE